MEAVLAWPVRARAKVVVREATWLLEAYASGPDRRCNGEFKLLTPEQVRPRIEVLPQAKAVYDEWAARLSYGIGHTQDLWPSSATVGGLGDGICVTPQSRWKSQFLVPRRGAEALIASCSTRKN